MFVVDVALNLHITWPKTTAIIQWLWQWQSQYQSIWYHTVLYHCWLLNACHKICACHIIS